MAQIVKPSKLPRWADNPPGGTIVEPSEPEKDAGYQPGKPRRTFTNWLLNLAYGWLNWISSAMFNWADLGRDWADTLNGALPTSGAGLVGTSGIGPAYVEGRRVAGPSEAHTYTASKDTYVDLDYENVWHYVVVPNLDPEPAVTAHSIRIAKVVTNATDRTSVVDYRDARVPVFQDVNFIGRIWALVNNNNLLAAFNTRRISPASYTLIHENVCATGVTIGHPTVRVWISLAGETVITVNAYQNGSGNWVADVDGLATKTIDGSSGFARYKRNALVATPWNDTSDWTKLIAIDNSGVVVGDLNVQTNLNSTGVIASADVQAGGNFNWASPFTGLQSIAGASATLKRTTVWDIQITDGTLSAALAHSSGSGNGDFAMWRIHIPDGATIFSVNWWGTNTVPGGEFVRGRILRIKKSDGTVDDMLTAHASWANDVSYAARDFGALNVTKKVINNSAYAYALWINASDLATPVISELEVNYSMPHVAGA